MMEPPPKRLRILQSVEVDESSPDYIAAKQKQQERFKGTLESLFAKYGTMHESQSDEITINDGKIVVNRGHLRRAARHGTLTASNLLNSVAAGDAPIIGEGSDSEGDNEDSEDELAPTQPTKPSGQKDKSSRRVISPQGAQSSPAISTPIPVQAQTPRTASLSTAQIVPFTPDPAANLLQHIQFPQTPAGQQAQTSFYTALTQTINQAVQLAVAPLFSSILPATPIAPSLLTNVPPPQATRADTVDTVAAAKDPKWFFPPLPEQAREELAARCLSKPRPVASSPPLDMAEQQEQLAQEDSCTPELPEQSTISVATLVRSQEPADSETRTSARRSSPRVEIQHSRRGVQQSNKRPSTIKWVFSEADEIYIAKRKTLHGQSWTEIKNSKKKWKNFPTWVFSQRYAKRFHPQQLHLRATPAFEATESAQETPEAEYDALPCHHLPTPSSLEQEDSEAHIQDAAPAKHEQIFSSSTHFDDDERDLLSLAGDDSANEQIQFESAAEDVSCPDADETILESVELSNFTNEHIFQQDLLDGSPLGDVCTESLVIIKEESAPSSPLNKRKRRRIEVPYQAMPDSECDADTHNDSDYHETIEHPTSKRNPQSKSPSLNLIDDDDELQATPITNIKREFSTPPPTNLLFRTPAPQSRAKQDFSSSGVKSTSGMSRRKLHNQIKQGWAKRKSFHIEPRKRKREWEEGDGEERGNRHREGSVDELAG